MKKKITALFSALTLFVLSFCAFGQYLIWGKLQTVDLETFSSEVSRIVSSFDDDISSEERADGRTYRIIVKSELKVNKLNAVDSASGYDGLQVFQFADAASADKALKYYNSLKSVVFASEDKLMYTDDVCETVADLGGFYVFAADDDIHPTKPQSDACGITALREYLEESGTELVGEVVVAVVDSGVDSDHPFISDRLVSGGTNFTGSGTAEDEFGHGTHVAGIVADNTPENVKIASYRVLNSVGQGSELQTANGIYAAVEDGVNMINLSLTISSDSDIIHEAVKKAYENDISVVCAAGNSSADLSKVTFSPACFSETITVMNVSNDYTEKAKNSNYGKPCDIAAPGMGVISSYTNGRYREMSGTSMASPFVCSAASYLILTGTATTPDEIKTVLKEYSIAAAVQGYAGGLWAEYITREPVDACELSFSKEAGKFQREFYLELSCNVEDATIYYKATVDGLESDFKEYTEPFYIKDTTTVEAVAYKKGCKTSGLITNVYEANYSDTDVFWESDLNGVVTEYKHFTNDIVVPEYIKGVKTTGITAGVFDSVKPIAITFPDSVTSLPDDALKGYTLLASVTANGVESIGNSAFEGCESLTKINLPSVKTVGDNAFKDTGLKEALLPSAEYIGSGAFENCTALEKADVSSVKNMGQAPFNNCTALKELSMASLTELKKDDFLNSAVKYEMYFPSVLSVEEGAFNNTSANTVVFESVKSCASLPTGAKAALPSTAETLTATGSSFCASASFEKFSLEGLAVTKLDSTTAIYSDLPADYFKGSGDVYFGALGFSREYKWYGSKTDGYNGTLIEGETAKAIDPSDYLNYEYFYCEVKSTDKDGEVINIRSSVLRRHTVTQNEWAVYKEPTCTEEGVGIKYCDECGEIVLRNPIEPTGHTWKHNEYADEHPHYSIEKCKECDETRVNTEKTGKKMSKCIDCQYDYESDGNGGIRITKCKKTNTTFTVPEEINGLPVTEIGDGAFSELKAINIVLSDGVKKIGSNAFSNCTRLTRLQIPTTLEEISDNAVEGCSDILYISCRESTLAYKFAKRMNVAIFKIVDFILGDNAHLSEEHQLVIIAEPGSDGTLESILTFVDGITSRLIPSYDYGKTQIYATGSLIDVTTSLYGEAVYRIVVPSDLNGDGVVDVLDVAYAERMLSGHVKDVDYCVELAATNDRGGEITVEDYSRIVNDALAS